MQMQMNDRRATVVVAVLAALVCSSGATPKGVPAWMVRVDTGAQTSHAASVGNGCHGVLIAPDVVLTSSECPVTTNDTVSRVNAPKVTNRILAHSLHVTFEKLFNDAFSPGLAAQLILLANPRHTNVSFPSLATSAPTLPISMLTATTGPDQTLRIASFPLLKETPVCTHGLALCTTNPCANSTSPENTPCHKVGTFLSANSTVYGLAYNFLYTDEESVFTPVSNVVPWVRSTLPSFRNLRAAKARAAICNAMFRGNKPVFFERAMAPRDIRRCAVTNVIHEFNALAFIRDFWHGCSCPPFPKNTTLLNRRYGAPIKGFKFTWGNSTTAAPAVRVFPRLTFSCWCSPLPTHVAAP
jgi:hypothetical protein